ncbi:hypothetical protein BM221_009804 [Beauveria bassiana]|uniref:Polymerase beta nucleotidyltransferase domain-containing protein n=1 Tax=Beauveria bassiana TaxID=176275 RepID=A0A2N6NAX6_BEABA|nr:hypothetical protein BM221_009804 [Beauveria bassiana]
MTLMTNRPVLPIPAVVATIGDISARLDPVLSSLAEHSRAAVVAWAGVFGSFARDKQTDASDVDLLVGLAPNATDDDVYYARGDVLAQLDETMGRKVDCFFLRHGQPLPFVLCRALLHAKTVHGSEAWLAENGARAKVLFAATMDKVQTLLGMMETLLAILDRKADEISATVCLEPDTLPPQLADGLRELVCYMYTRSNDQEAMDAYFHGVYDRLLPIKRIWDEYPHRVPLQMKSGEGRTRTCFSSNGITGLLS